MVIVRIIAKAKAPYFLEEIAKNGIKETLLHGTHRTCIKEWVEKFRKAKLLEQREAQIIQNPFFYKRLNSMERIVKRLVEIYVQEGELVLKLFDNVKKITNVELPSWADYFDVVVEYEENSVERKYKEVAKALYELPKIKEYLAKNKTRKLSTFVSFQRIVKDLCRKLGKEEFFKISYFETLFFYKIEKALKEIWKEELSKKEEQAALASPEEKVEELKPGKFVTVTPKRRNDDWYKEKREIEAAPKQSLKEGEDVERGPKVPSEEEMEEHSNKVLLDVFYENLVEKVAKYMEENEVAYDSETPNFDVLIKQQARELALVNPTNLLLSHKVDTEKVKNKLRIYFNIQEQLVHDRLKEEERKKELESKVDDRSGEERDKEVKEEVEELKKTVALILKKLKELDEVGIRTLRFSYSRPNESNKVKSFDELPLSSEESNKLSQANLELLKEIRGMSFDIDFAGESTKEN